MPKKEIPSEPGVAPLGPRSPEVNSGSEASKSGSPPSFSDLKSQYDIYRDYMKHEDDLINQRSTWHGAMQGLLFASFGVLLGWKQAQVDARIVHACMLVIVPALGILIASLACLSCIAADKAIENLSREWEEEILPFYQGVPLPRLPMIAGGGSNFAKNWGKWPSIGIPILIAIAWTILLTAAIRLPLMSF